MQTGAAAVASRLMHALGYRVAEAHITATEDGRRVLATRWPGGIDLGPTPIRDTRPDDPNDRVPHLERRTLRAMKLVAAWLALGEQALDGAPELDGLGVLA